jgi:hypothetical protein
VPLREKELPRLYVEETRRIIGVVRLSTSLVCGSCAGGGGGGEDCFAATLAAADSGLFWSDIGPRTTQRNVPSVFLPSRLLILLCCKKTAKKKRDVYHLGAAAAVKPGAFFS